MNKQLGTVLPDASTYRLADEFAKRQAAKKSRIAASSAELASCTRRIVGGEVRYYDTVDQYAIVSRQGAVLWFAVTPDGDRRI